MRPAWIVLGLLAITLLAGCGDKPAPDVAPDEACTLEPALCDPDNYLATHHCIANDVRPRVYAPDTGGPDVPAKPWVQGDWWSYDVRADDRSFASTLVYYDDADVAGGIAQHYLVGAASQQEAFDHALFSVNPMLGRIHRALYSPHESGLHADMFAFPLCEGSTWTTGFYDTTFEMTAHRATVPLPGGAVDALGFRIDGESMDGSTLTLHYSPVANWFTTLDLQRADGVQVSMDLTGSGSGRQGTYYFLRAQQDEVLDVAKVGSNGAVVGRTDGGEGPYQSIGVWMDVQRSAGSGKVEVHLRDPTGLSRVCVGIAGTGPVGQTNCLTNPLKVAVPYAAGDWSVTVEKQLGDFQTQATGEVRVVSIYDRSGTV